MKKIFVILLFLTSCGYQPLYLNNNLKKNEFQKIVLKGDNEINRKIVNRLQIKENEFDKELNELLINSLYNVSETSKNSKGIVETYRSKITVLINIKKNKKIVKSKEFSKDFSYSNRDNKFELVQYQNKIKSNLIDKSIEEINLYLNIE
tara:strand:+ start:304 stop:750 length:447 start_codon:yes stop_codon:yes gene_type:complete